VQRDQTVPDPADTLTGAPVRLAGVPLQPEQVFSAPRALGRIDLRLADEGVHEEGVLVHLVSLLGGRFGTPTMDRVPVAGQPRAR
jgi:hypothetical protein